MKHGVNRVIPEKVATHYPVTPILMSISKEFGMYCKCGCGQKTKVVERTRKERGWVKGQHKPFLYRHYKRDPNKSVDMLGKGINHNGYEYTTNHALVHRLIAERILGKKLPATVHVHHHDGDRSNNENSNLVVCQNNSYHLLMHSRKRAYDSCGNASHRKCPICKEYDSTENMVNYSHLNNTFFHRECSRIKARADHRSKKDGINTS